MRILQCLNLATCGLFKKCTRSISVEDRADITCRLPQSNNYFIVSQSREKGGDKFVALVGCESELEMKEEMIKVEQRNSRIIKIIIGKENLKDFIDVNFIFYSNQNDYDDGVNQPEFKIN